MKKLLAIFFAIAIYVTASAQAYEGRAEVSRKQYVSAVIEVPYNSDVVEDAIKAYMAKTGFKPSSTKGVQTYKSVKLHPNNTENNDLHFKVERKSRKEKEFSLIYLIVSKENESLSQRMVEDRAGIEDAKSYLNAMVPSLEAYNLEVQITGQDETVKKAEKKLENLVEDQQDLEKKIKNLQEKLEKNKKDQESQKGEISNQRIILETLKGRRKPA